MAAAAVEKAPTSADSARIGDTVLLYENELGGFMYADNAVNSPVTFVRVDNPAQPNLPNVKGAVFEITAPNKYKNAKRLKKRLKKYDKSKLNADDDDPEIIELRKLARAEARDNVMEKARQRGRTLVYGQTVQLRNVMTNRFLFISSTDPAELDVTNMHTSLSEDTSKNTFFRIMPRFKVRSEGDLVRFEDQIVLESIKTSSQFLHISAKAFPPNSLNAGAHEIDLSVHRSSFVLKLHAPSHAIPESLVQHGDVLALLHKESDSFVSAEGSFDNFGIGENVHLRRRKVKSADSAIRTNVSLCYWQIEHDAETTTGSVVMWGTFLRLRHMCTRRYLTLTIDGSGTGKIGTTDQAKDPNAVFLMHPVTKGDGLEAVYNTYCRLQHAVSKTWLHAIDKPYERQQYKREAGASGMDLLEWDHAQLRLVNTIKEMRYDDAFALIPVDDELVNNFNFVAGISKVLARHIAIQRKQAAMETADYIALTEVLNALMTFLKEDDTRKAKAKQKILRHLRIVDALILVLKTPFKASAGFERIADFNPNGIDMEDVTKHPRLESVCRLVYDLLAKYLHGSHKNEVYVARHISFFQSQVGHDLHTADMLLELVRDNRQVLDRIEPAQIRAFIAWLRKRENPAFLNFLGVLCVCDGKPIAATQYTVVEELLAMQSEKALLYTARDSKVTVDNETIDSLEVSRDGKEWRDIREFMHKEKEAASFYLAQLDVFSSVCTGRNERNIGVLFPKFLTRQHVILGVTDNRLGLKPELRTALSGILLNAFVDVNPNSPVLASLKLAYAWEQVHVAQGAESSKTPGLSITGATFENFAVIHKFVVEHLKSNASMIASHVAENRFTAAVLRVIVRLTIFGYYTNVEFITELLRALFDLIDMATDRKSSKQGKQEQKEWMMTGECFMEAPENAAMAEVKYQGALIMDALFNFRLGTRISSFLYDYKMLDGYSKAVGAGTRGVANIAGELIALLPAFTDDPSKPVSTDAVLQYLSVLRKRDDWLDVYDEHRNGRLVNIFLTVGRYKYPHVTFMATNIVNRHYTQVWNLFEKASWSRLMLTNESVECNRIVQEKLAILRRFLGVKMQRSEQILVRDSIKQLGDLCSLKNDALETHSVNVMIMYQSKALQTIFSTLAAPVDKDVKEDYAGMVEIITEGLNFLQKFCRNNALIQEKMFERLGFLLNLGEVAVRPLANCLTQMFRGNQELCLKLSEKHVERMAAYMARFKAFEISQFFNVIVKIESLQLPIRRNQNMVIKQLLQRRSETILMVDPKDDPERIKMLEEGSTKTRAMNKLDKNSDEYKQWWVSDENRKLLYHVRLVRMLATCCEGENRFIESMCQNIFSARQLLNVLENANINMNFRRPYLRFFLWAYLNSDSTAVESELGEVQLMPELWKFMGMLIDQVRIVFGQDLGKIFETDEGEQDVIFLFEGAVPFLRVFFDRHFSATAELLSTVPQYVELASRTIDTVLDFIDRMYLFPEFGTKRRIKEATTVLLVMQTKELIGDDQDNRVQDILQKELNRVKDAAVKRRPVEVDDEGKPFLQEAEIGLDKVFMAKTSRRTFFETYERELKLNDHVHNFTRNLDKAYRANPSTPRYSRSDPSGAGLPLGEEFQQQISSFVDYDDKKRHKNGKPRYIRLNKNCEVLVHALLSSRQNIEFMSESDRVIQIELDLKHLRLLRTAISFEVLQLPKEVKDNEDLVDEVSERIITTQNDLNSIGVSNIILVMCTSPEEFTVRAALRLLAMMLFGGNRVVQNTLLATFRATRNESFFQDLRDRIVRSSVAVKEARALQAQLSRDKQKRQKLLSNTLKGSTIKKMTHAASERRETIQVSTGKSDSVEMRLITPNGPVRASTTQMSEEQIEKMSLEAAKALDDEKDEDIVKFKSLVGFTELIFRILQLFCERHNQEIKSYMREQKGNIKSVNLVSDAVDYMHVIYLNIDDQSWSLANQVMQTIVEFEMGEAMNQSTIFDAKVIDVVNHLLRCLTFEKCSAQQIFTIKRIAAILVRSMVEDGNERTKKMAREVRTVLDLPAVRQTMRNYSPSVPVNENEGFDPSELGFVCYSIMCRLRDNLVGEEPMIEYDLRLKVDTGSHSADEAMLTKFDDDEEEEFAKLEDEEDRMEARRKQAKADAELIKTYEKGMESIEILRNGSLQKVYFPVGKQRESLSDNRKDSLLWTVNRDSPNEKIRDFLDKGERLRSEMKYQEIIMRNVVFRTILSLDNVFYNLVLLLTLVINIIILASWQADGLQATLPITPPWYLPVIYILGSIHVVLSICTCAHYILENPIHEVRDLFKASHIYYIVFLGMSAGGLATHGYLYCFHLLHIVMKNDILKRALQSVTKNGDSLLMVALLGIILIYIFSVIVFAFYRNGFDPTSGFFCDSMWQCFITSLDWGLRSGGGLGDVLLYTNLTWPYVGLRVIFDLAFFIIITTIGLNIIFGLIIDTFSELRDEKYRIAEDMRSSCFICSLQAYDFDKSSVGFETHIKREHNMWAYLFFLNYLENKEADEYTALEDYVSLLAEQKETAWFPINRAFALQESRDEVVERLDRIETQLQGLVDRFKAEDERRMVESQQQQQNELLTTRA